MYLTDVSDIRSLPDKEKRELRTITQRYPFLANDYYLDLINWDDPHDPIRRIIIPHPSELLTTGSLDPSNEHKYTVCRGVEHKYTPTALLLATNTCGGLCRFCFRKRIFLENNREIAFDFNNALTYFTQHKEINNILITGGDPLTLPIETIEKLLNTLRAMDHIRFVRIGTKLPAYNPHRIIEHASKLSDLIRTFQKEKKRVYIITHFNHHRELTATACEAINILRSAGAVIANQTPLLRGINDRPDLLVELFNKLAAAGAPPYYVFQCRPTVGNCSFSVPIEAGYEIFEKAKSRLSGLAKRARYIISHETGKLEVAVITKERIFFKYQNAAKAEMCGKTISYSRNPEAKWLNDYINASAERTQQFISLYKSG